MCIVWETRMVQKQLWRSEFDSLESLHKLFSKDFSTVSISMWTDKAGINSKTTSVYLLWGKIKERKKGLACFLGAEDFILQEQGDTQPQHPSPLEVPSRPTVSNLCIYQNVDTGVA